MDFLICCLHCTQCGMYCLLRTAVDTVDTVDTVDAVGSADTVNTVVTVDTMYTVDILDTCQISCVMCQVSLVRCHMSVVTCQLSHIFSSHWPPPPQFKLKILNIFFAKKPLGGNIEHIIRKN